MTINSKKQYSIFRDQILGFIRRDIEGPYSKDEVIDESPSTKYSVGILFPQLEIELDRDTISDADITSKSDEDIDVMDYSSAFYPSAAGLSFTVNAKVETVNIELSYGTYKKITSKDYDKVKFNYSGVAEVLKSNITYGEYFDYTDSVLTLKRALEKHDFDMLYAMAGENVQIKGFLRRANTLYNYGWYREDHNVSLPVNITANRSETKLEGAPISMSVISKDIPNSVKKIVTCSVVNVEKDPRPKSSIAKSIFQTKMQISLSENEKFEDMNANSQTLHNLDDTEEGSLDLLFRKKKVYSTGHGISARWDISDDGITRHISTETIPSYRVPQMEFDIKTDDGSKLDLSMSSFAVSESEYVLNNLNKLIDLYEGWINEIEKEIVMFSGNIRDTAIYHIERCRSSSSRMREGVNLLSSSAEAMVAFRDANQAMNMQRVHTLLQEEKTVPGVEKVMPRDYSQSDASWRPFQIAFILINLQSMYDSKSKDRDIVDLIWFPTGGGKTEAYLGLTAFTIFIRRILYPDSYGGTSVIMRYTLRLLTAQQFQRACTLICACEKIRKNNPRYGDEVISVGLWLGGETTPNDLVGANIKIAELNTSSTSLGNPFQVIACPWCGTYTTKHDGHGSNCYQIKSKPKKHLHIWCPNEQCDFFNGEGGLPIKVIDEDIYNSPPTLLFGTVDKFAMLPWQKKSSSIFAMNINNNNLSPSLIIQDELHLISGALGTMVGLYETAIDILCSKKGIRPKIIASTATIRRAKEQCKALYARDIQQFPAPGLDAADSFFARESDINDKTPGRLYAGIMPSGKTATSLQVDLTANITQSVEFIEADDNIKDAYWTQVIYCNSIRELSSSRTVVKDDVGIRSGQIMRRLGKKPRYINDTNTEELTSRVKGDHIPDILRKLDIQYPSERAIDVLLATNMLSVGIDIDRLGLMVVLGQPKTTSEYIQATSRVGRRYPGLVIAQLSPTKSRDRSHYEQFIKYHQSLYRYVEPTSVTPFSPPARDKALHAVLFTLIRHSVGLYENKDLENFSQKQPEIQEAINDILKRVDIIDPFETQNTKKELEDIVIRLNEILENSEGINYQAIKDSAKIPLMKSPTDTKSKGIYSTPQSMRNTDSECYVTLEYS